VIGSDVLRASKPWAIIKMHHNSRLKQSGDRNDTDQET
jgi:hypothetical protein